MYKHSDLDKRICDLEEGATNTETLREFIDSSQEEFQLDILSFMCEEDLNKYIDFLEKLWEK